MDDEKQEYEARLRRRLALLQEEIAAGKVKFAAGLKVIESLKAVRFGPDGEVDLSTVDAGVRALALAAEGARHREETKKIISLADLQRGYFDFIERNFGHMYRDMRKEGASPFQLASAIANDPEAVRDLYQAVPEVLSWTQGLWKEAGDGAQLHAEDTAGLKAVFGGETFPQGYKNVVSSIGVYVDTVILPDPFLRSSHVLTGTDQSAAVRTMMTGALSLLNYREAALADVDVPLVAIVPDATFINEGHRELVFGLADTDALAHLNRLFGATFSSLDEARNFLQSLTGPDDVVRCLADPARLLFDVEDTETVEANLANYMKQLGPLGVSVAHAGEAVMISAMSRMRQANDILVRSRELRGVPLIDAETSWRYFNWKLGYVPGGDSSEALFGMHMTKALQSASEGEMQWLGSVPIEALIEMRKVGALPELRSLLSNGVKELMELRPDNFHRTSDKVAENIQRAFDEHRKQLSTLTGKKWRFAGVELAGCVVKGAAQIASAVGVPGISLIGAAIDQLVDIPKIKDVPKRARSLRDETKALQGSAVGMLFRIAEGR